MLAEIKTERFYRGTSLQGPISANLNMIAKIVDLAFRTGLHAEAHGHVRDAGREKRLSWLTRERASERDSKERERESERTSEKERERERENERDRERDRSLGIKKVSLINIFVIKVFLI